MKRKLIAVRSALAEALQYTWLLTPLDKRSKVVISLVDGSDGVRVSILHRVVAYAHGSLLPSPALHATRFAASK